MVKPEDEITEEQNVDTRKEINIINGSLYMHFSRMVINDHIQKTIKGNCGGYLNMDWHTGFICINMDEFVNREPTTVNSLNNLLNHVEGHVNSCKISSYTAISNMNIGQMNDLEPMELISMIIFPDDKEIYTPKSEQEHANMNVCAVYNLDKSDFKDRKCDKMAYDDNFKSYQKIEQEKTVLLKGKDRIYSVSVKKNNVLKKQLKINQIGNIHDPQIINKYKKVVHVDNVCNSSIGAENQRSETVCEDTERRKHQNTKFKTREWSKCNPDNSVFEEFVLPFKILKGSEHIPLQVVITREYFEDSLQEVRLPSYLWISDNDLILSKRRTIEEDLDFLRAAPLNEHMERLYTFIKGYNPNGILWDDTQIVRPGPLASAGFSFEGIKDHVSCKSCGCTTDVNDWSDDDEDYALSVHRQLAKDCDFIKIFGGTNMQEKN